MHPIERLRYVARASGADQALLVSETAHALWSFHDDPAGLVTACRRVLDRHPTAGPLWSLCAEVLTSPDPALAAREVVGAIENDPTARRLAHELADSATVCVVGWPEVGGAALARRGDVMVLALEVAGEAAGLVRWLGRAGTEAEEVPASGVGAAVSASEVVLLEAVAFGPGGFVAASGSLAAAAVARYLGVPVWVAAGAGRRLPGPLWTAVADRLTAGSDEPWLADEEIVPLDLVAQVWGPEGPSSPADAVKGAHCPVAPELVSSGAVPGTYRDG